MRVLTYITHATFTDRDFERFGCKELQKLGYLIRVLDLSVLLYPSEPSILDAEKYRRMRVRYAQVGTILELRDYLSSNVDETCFISIGQLSGKIMKNFLDRQRTVFAMFLGPIPDIRISLYERVRAKLSFQGLVKLYEKFKYASYRPNYCLKVSPVGNEYNVFAAHSFDYYMHLLGKSKEDTKKADIESSIVFLDQNLVFHKDFSRAGKRNASAQESMYFSRLNEVFNRIEKLTGKRVVIAAHPSVECLSSYSDFFEGRAVYEDCSEELVSNADLCVTHYTTAVNLSVIYKKPVIFLKCEEMSVPANLMQQCLAQQLGSCVYTLDHFHEGNEDMLSIPKVDEGKYQEYFNRFLSQAPAEKLNGQLISEYVEMVSEAHG